MSECNCGVCSHARADFSAASEISRLIAENEKLRAENERLKEGYLADENGNEYVAVCILKEKIREQQSRLTEKEAQVGEYEKILKWYGVKEHYCVTTERLSCECCSDIVDAKVDLDGGENARNALARYAAEGEGKDG